MIGQPMQPSVVRSQMTDVGPSPYVAKVTDVPMSYPSVYWNERKAGEPFDLMPVNTPMLVASGATVDTSVETSQDYWYEIKYLVISLVPNAGGAAGVSSTQYPVSIRTRLASGDLSICPNFVPIFGMGGDGRHWESAWPVDFMLKPNMSMQLFFRNDSPIDLNIFCMFRTKRHISKTGERR